MERLLVDLREFERESQQYTFYGMLQETRPQTRFETSSDILDAMIGIRYYSLQHYARFCYLHKIVHSQEPREDFYTIEELTRQCFQTAWISFDIFDGVMQVRELVTPDLVCLLHMYEPPSS
jgi:hypothetical protein